MRYFGKIIDDHDLVTKKYVIDTIDEKNIPDLSNYTGEVLLQTGNGAKIAASEDTSTLISESDSIRVVAGVTSEAAGLEVTTDSTREGIRVDASGIMVSSVPTVGDTDETLALNSDIPTKLSELSDDANHKLVTDANITNWNNKQSTATLESDVAAKGFVKQSYVDTEVKKLDTSISTLTTAVNNKANSADVYSKYESDSKYAEISHNHDEVYSPLGHNHDERYYTEAEADGRFATKSEIPSVNNGVLTIQKNGTTIQTFSANQSTNITANIAVPTKTSDIKNDSGYVTTSDIATVERTTNKVTSLSSASTDAQYPSAKVVYNKLTNKADLVHDHVKAEITDFPGIINNVESTSSTDVLSAYQGKLLNDRINNLESRGRFLALWDCTTGKPTSEPQSYPYKYRTGDWFRITKVGTTNYIPSGTQYTGVASTTVYSGSETLKPGDCYWYDGENWRLEINHAEITVADVKINNTSIVSSGVANITVDELISSTSTNPIQTKTVYTALQGKAPTTHYHTGSDITDLESAVSAKGFTKNAGTITGIKMNGSSVGSSGVVDLGTVITAHQNLSNYVQKDGSKVLSDNNYTTTEKNKLNGIASGAEVNQNAFSNVVIGSTTISADAKQDSLTFIAGDNITLTPNATNDSITIASSGSGGIIIQPVTGSFSVSSTATTKTVSHTFGSAPIQAQLTLNGNLVSVPVSFANNSVTFSFGAGNSGTYEYAIAPLSGGSEGPQGPAGPAGQFSSVTAAVGTNVPSNPPSVNVSYSNGNAAFTFNNIKGEKGDKGDTGATGPAGSSAWSNITGKPTTLSGYGITDAAASNHTHTQLSTLALTSGNSATSCVRNIMYGSSTPTSSQGNVGDVYIVI